jgi:hypothetical protein
MMARLPGIINAAPKPWTPRAITRVPGSGASPARRGGQREDHDADREDAAAAKEIADRPTSQDHGREHQRVALHHPLHRGKGSAEALLQHRQGDIDDGHVGEGHGRGDDGRRENPFLLFAIEGRGVDSGTVHVGGD